MKTKGATKKDKPAESAQDSENVKHKKAAFLRAYRKLQGKALAAEAIGRTTTTVWRWEQEDADFRAAVLDVEELNTDELEQMLRERAKEKSDLLGIFLLKGARPEKYRENISLEASGKGGGPIQVDVVNYAAAAKPKSGKEGSA